MKKFNYIHCIFFLIKYILSSTDYDLGQYQLLSGIINPCITFDSSGFKIDEEIYIKKQVDFYRIILSTIFMMMKIFLNQSIDVILFQFSHHLQNI